MKIKKINEFLEFDNDDEGEIKDYLYSSNNWDKEKRFTKEWMKDKNPHVLLAASILNDFERIKKMMELNEEELNEMVNYISKIDVSIEDPYGEEDWNDVEIPGKNKKRHLESILSECHNFIGELNNFNYYMNKEKWKKFNDQ